MGTWKGKEDLNETSTLMQMQLEVQPSKRCQGYIPERESKHEAVTGQPSKFKIESFCRPETDLKSIDNFKEIEVQ